MVKVELTKEHYEMILKMVKGSPMFEEGTKEPVLNSLREAKEA